MEKIFGVKSKIIDKELPTSPKAKITNIPDDESETTDDTQPTSDKPEKELKQPSEIRTFFNTNWLPTLML